MVIPNSKRILFLFLIFFISFSIPLQAHENYQFTTYTQENGLVSGTIRGIKKDLTGYIWLLSENGLTRFDGYTFKKFQHIPSDSSSIPSMDVRNLFQSRDGEILFQTANGFCKYIPSRSGFKKIISFSSRDEYVGALGSENGFWIIKSSGLIYLNSKNELSKEYKFPSSYKARALHLSLVCDTKIWLSDGDSMLCFNPITKQFSFKHLVGINTAQREELSIYHLFSQNGNAPCFYSSQGLFKYNAKQNAFEFFSKSNLHIEKNNPVDGAFFTGNYLIFSLRFNQLFCIQIYTGEEHWIDLSKYSNSHSNNIQISSFDKINENEVWVSTSTQGIFKVNIKTNEISQIYNDASNRFSLPSNNIDIVLRDNQVLWLVSPGMGLIKGEFIKTIFQTYRPFEKNYYENFTLSNNIRTIAELDPNNLLIGGLDGLLTFNKQSKKFSLFSPQCGTIPVLNKNAISRIIKDRQGNIWISVWGRDGIFVISKDGKKVRNINPADRNKPTEYKSLRSILIDSHGYLWVGTDNNIIFKADVSKFNFDDNSNLAFTKINASSSTQDTLNFNIVFALTESPSGQVLIGTQSGFYIFDYNSHRFKRFVNNIHNDASISANDVRAIFIDKEKQIWLATNGGGLNLYNPQNQTFINYTTANGLSDNCIYSILEDSKGFLWLGTNKGLNSFNKKLKTCRIFLLKDGIQNYEFNTNSALKTHDGKMVFGGINGFNIFNPDSIELNTTPPSVVLTEFKVSDMDRSFDSIELHLGPDENYVSFQFAALNFYRNSENNYAYKLDGLNKDWIYCGDRRFTNYANLSPGSYTFRVKASNSFGIWSEKDAVIQFHIATPWFNTWLFYALLVLTVSGIVYFIYHYRLRQAIELQSVRNSIARDLHDEIGSNLSSISIFTEVAKDKNSHGESNISPLLQKISEYTQTSQEAMNDIVWMINTRNDRFENIIVRMRSLTVELLEAKNILLHLHFDDRLNQLKMGMNERKNFYLIYKEALNNIVKYAQCENVWVDLNLLNSAVHLKIVDDGKGFDSASFTAGNGLVNMKKRVEVLKGTFHIDSIPGKGTTLELSFHLN